MKKQYDYLLVGSGLFAGVFAYYAKAGKTCLVLEKREHAGGNIYCENIEGINVHRYGPISSTHQQQGSLELCEQSRGIQPLHKQPGCKLQGRDVQHAVQHEHLQPHVGNLHSGGGKRSSMSRERSSRASRRTWKSRPSALVGTHIYQKLVKGLHLRNSGAETARNSQPSSSNVSRYATPTTTTISMTFTRESRSAATIRSRKSSSRAVEIRLGADYLADKEKYDALADKVVYTGTIDSYFDYCFGKLQYRSLRFETEVLDCDNYQGNAVINYTDRETPYTRIIEHKHFEFGTQEKTVITRELPAEWTEGMEPYYPVNDEEKPGII